jgi:hypothetical protein
MTHDSPRKNGVIVSHVIILYVVAELASASAAAAAVLSLVALSRHVHSHHTAYILISQEALKPFCQQRQDEDSPLSAGNNSILAHDSVLCRAPIVATATRFQSSLLFRHE